MLIIGFGHKARRGKDSVAQAIIAARGDKYDIRRYAFADALKREANITAEQFGSMYGLITEWHRLGKLPDWVTYDAHAEYSDPLCPMGKQRLLLQWWGTEYRRAQNPFYWVKAAFKTILADKPQVALITDMRFFNEMYAIKEHVSDRIGFTVRLDRIGFDEGIGKTNHVSENELDAANVDGEQYDYAISVKDGDIDKLLETGILLFDIIVDEITPPSADLFTLEAMEASANAAAV